MSVILTGDRQLFSDNDLGKGRHRRTLIYGPLPIGNRVQQSAQLDSSKTFRVVGQIPKSAS